MYNNGKGRQGKLQLHYQESNKEFEIFTEGFYKTFTAVLLHQN